MSIAPSTSTRAARIKHDSVLAGAVDLARAVAVEEAEQPGHVGAHLGVVMVGERLAAHTFACEMRGYVGWQWTVTLARVPRGRNATVCEVHLLPTDDAILAPQWLPWSDRLAPGDIGPGDVLPFKSDDPRLVPGYKATGNEEEDQVAIEELALARTRILSETGRDEAASRWYSGTQGPWSPGSMQSAGSCGSCGFLVPLQGALGQVFGVCANMWSNDDGKVVAIGHGCGAHSETDVPHRASEWPSNHPIIDETSIVEVTAEELAAVEPLPKQTQADLNGADGASAELTSEQPADVSVGEAAKESSEGDGEKSTAPELADIVLPTSLDAQDADRAQNTDRTQGSGSTASDEEEGKPTGTQRRKNTRARGRKRAKDRAARAQISAEDNSDASSQAAEAQDRPAKSEAAAGAATAVASQEAPSHHEVGALELPTAIPVSQRNHPSREEALHSLDIIAASLPQRGSSER